MERINHTNGSKMQNITLRTSTMRGDERMSCGWKVEGCKGREGEVTGYIKEDRK